MPSSRPRSDLPPIGRLPVRPIPLPNESLLSWSTRLAIGNGLGLRGFLNLISARAPVAFPLPADRLDRTENKFLFKALAQAAGMEAKVIHALSDQLVRSNVISDLLLNRPRPEPKSAESSRDHYGGFLQPFCPMCLAGNFYLRRHWNLAFVTRCPTHYDLLLEQCPRCGTDLDFTAPEHHRWRQQQPRGTFSCWHCQLDLIAAARNPTTFDNLFSPPYLEGGLLQVAELPGGSREHRASRKAFFSALLQLLELVRDQGASRLSAEQRHPGLLAMRRATYQESACQGLGLPAFDPRWTVNPFREASCEVRHILLRMVGWLMMDRTKHKGWLKFEVPFWHRNGFTRRQEELLKEFACSKLLYPSKNTWSDPYAGQPTPTWLN